MKNIPAISNSDTKGAIIEKFNAVVEMLKTKDSTKLDPAKEVAQKAVIATLEKAKTISGSDINSQINEITEVVTAALCDALSGINTRVADYKDLDSAIILKKAELKDLFDIEAGAYALIALINMQDEQRTSFDIIMADKRTAAHEALQAIIADTQERRSIFNTEMAEARKELEANRKREAVEFKYDLDRSRKLEADKWADTQAAKLKAFNDELAVQQTELDTFAAKLDRRAEEVAVRETAVNELELQVAAIPSLIEVAAAKAAKEAKASADMSNGFAERSLKKDAESAAALAAAQINTLQAALEAEKARTVSLESKLDAAYDKIESISGKAVDAASGAQYVNRMESNFKEQNSKLGLAK